MAYSAGTFSLEIEGQFAGYLNAVEGGEPPSSLRRRTPTRSCAACGRGQLRAYPALLLGDGAAALSVDGGHADGNAIAQERCGRFLRLQHDREKSVSNSPAR